MESFRMTTVNWLNIFLLGGGFFLLFTAFQTTAFVQGVTLDSFLAPSCKLNGSNSTVYYDGGIPITEEFSKRIGYISLCIIYLMVALGNWVSVPVVTVFGSKWSLVISGALYVVYIVAVIRPYVPTIFLGALILGSAGGVLWTAQGQILIQNSSKERMSTTSGIFWFMLQQSLVFGNLFYFLYLKLRVRGQTCIPAIDNYVIFGFFTILGIAGVILMLFIVPVKRRKVLRPGSLNDDNESKGLISEGTEDSQRNHPEDLRAACSQAVQSLVKAVKMLCSVDMLLLSVVFIYTGYELNFWSGVYGPVVGHTQLFPGYVVGLAGLFVGLGEILGGALFGILGKYTNRFGKDPIVLLGLLVHFATFLLVFYNFPVLAVFENVSPGLSRGSLFPSNIYVAIVCAFMLGFGDACFNTQIYSIIGNLYPKDDESAPAMALFKFFQSLAAMVGFLTSTKVTLQWQLLVLVILATLGTLTFATVEWKHYNKHKPNEKSK